MKQVIPVLFLFTIFITNINKNKDFIIPDEAIRFRIIANSNNLYDQQEKMQIKNKVENYLTLNLLKATNQKEAKTIIKNNIKEIDQIVNDNYSNDYNIKYGKNYFPEKTYKGVKYKEGYYESLVISLGEGKGDNWWCLLFPPLCLIDDNTKSNQEYHIFVKDIFDKYQVNKNKTS